MTYSDKAADVVFEKVTRMFGKVAATREVSFHIQPGTLTTLVGPSGCGKTTMLRMIAGLDTPTSGRILIGGKDVTLLPATTRDVTMVFQSYALFPHMTVVENVAYGLRMSNWAKADALARAEEGLAMFGLDGLGKRLPGELSGGQQQRAAVARALVIEPQVLLFDEPLSNLDARLRRKVRTEIRELQQKLGLTAVYVTHDQDEALAVSDNIIIMNNGEIAQEGSPREIYQRPDNVFVASFIGDANMVKAQLVGHDGKLASVQLGKMTLQLPRRDMATGEVTLAVRPEAVVLTMTDGGDAIEGTIYDASYLGGQMEYLVDTPLGQLFVIDMRGGEAFRAQDKVFVSFTAQGVSLVRD